MAAWSAQDASEAFPTRAEAGQALWRMIDTGQADCTQDRRFRAFVLLATFASFRWGEISASRHPAGDHSSA
jgi:hypothetical protein